jgi:hypothetical protein
MSPENTIHAPTSQKRIDANRKNAARSTGPRTPSGKNRSRLNALKHGLTAAIPVLPGEDPTRYQARVEAMVESFAPQNQIEVDLLERVAATTWSLERAARAEVAQLRHRIRHDAIDANSARPKKRRSWASGCSGTRADPGSFIHITRIRD